MNIMEPIYTFNGQDITMLICLLIRDVVNEIQKRSNLSFGDAVDAFYASTTYATLQNTENALWAEPAGYIADMYFTEKEKKQAACA